MLSLSKTRRIGTDAGAGAGGLSLYLASDRWMEWPSGLQASESPVGDHWFAQFQHKFSLSIEIPLYFPDPRESPPHYQSLPVFLLPRGLRTSGALFRNIVPAAYICQHPTIGDIAHDGLPSTDVPALHRPNRRSSFCSAQSVHDHNGAIRHDGRCSTQRWQQHVLVVTCISVIILLVLT